MEEGKTLEQLGCETWRIVWGDPDGTHLRVNWEPVGFGFICLTFASQICEPDAPIEYEVLFEGVAYFDGVRHLHFGKEETGNYGYLNYPDIPDIIEAMQALDKEQLKLEYVKTERGNPEKQ